MALRDPRPHPTRARRSSVRIALALLAAWAFAASPISEPAHAEPLAAASSASAGAAPSAPPSALPLPDEPSRAAIGERPTVSGATACLVGRVCAHDAGAGAAATEHAATVALAALRALEALRLPLPLADGARGGGPALDVYVGAALDDARALADVGLATSTWDRGPAFVIAPGAPPGSGCAPEQAIARAVAEAALLGLDAATDPDALRMTAQHLASIVAPCSLVDLEAVDTGQRAPDRGLFADPAAHLLFAHLEERYGNGSPGEIAASLVAISGQRSGTGALLDEPDAFDALRVTRHLQGASLADTVLDLAVARAFLGTRSDDAHLVDAARYGDLGRPRFEWSVDFTTLPRRLLPARPVASLGATYLWLDLSTAPLASEITFVAEWEAPVVFRWALVELDAQGAERTRTDVIPVFGTTRVERTLRDVGGVGSLVIVGINEGEARRDEPPDPSRPPIAPRSYQVSLYR